MPQQFTTTLGDMVGHIRSVKPNENPNLIRDWLNQEIRSALDRKPVWAGTIKRGNISVPASYSTGTVTLANGSATMTGSATSWPTNDKVNTTVSAAVTDIGLQWITPASMTGIDCDTVLCVDSAGTLEILPVLETTRTQARVDFKRTHSASFAIISSSLVGRQVRFGNQYPIYTIRAVNSSTSITLDNEWSSTAYTAGSYTILKMYYTLSPDVKTLITVIDPVTPYALQINYGIDKLNFLDPQRMATGTGTPLILADMSPNEAGNMQYELYPPQTSARNLYYVYSCQWPDMRASGDRPPYFINPNVFLWGALAQALNHKVSERDPYYDPQSAMRYRQMADRELLIAMQADENKAQTQLKQDMRRLGTGFGAEWSATHDVTVAEMNFGGRWW